MSTLGFTIYEQDTGEEIVTLPLTFPIADSMEKYKRAGYKVGGWKWHNEG
mgnify:CR=1 FL=1